jgi:hypothetical protein
MLLGSQCIVPKKKKLVCNKCGKEKRYNIANNVAR